MPEIDENHPYVQFLKKQINDLDTELGQLDLGRLDNAEEYK